MKRLRDFNINTQVYFDEQFEDKKVDKQNLLRQNKYLEHVKRGDTVIELGCGMSYFPEMARLKGARSYGVDFSMNAITSLKYQFPNVFYIKCDAQHTPFPDGKFDVVVSGEVLEHMEDPYQLPYEMARICKKGGKIILSTPHLEFDDPEHLWEFEEEDLKEILGQFGDVSCETIQSTKFPGREYLIAICVKH